jgi:hypothetical protein
MNVELLRKVPVLVNPTRDIKNRAVVELTVGDKYQHTFDHNSRVSQALNEMPVEQLQARLSGGHYFFVDDQLVDFRDGGYQGFIHTADSINKLIEVIGIQKVGEDGEARRSGTRRILAKTNQISKNVVLGKKWSDANISIPMYREGGEFQSQLNFMWNPFVKVVNSAFMIYRLICTNGAMGLSNLLNSRIPLINLHSDNLEIANRQIQNKLDGMIKQRLMLMGSERATVAELDLIHEHVVSRLGQVLPREEMSRLGRIAEVVNPRVHLDKVYSPTVFNDKQLAAQLPGHLTAFDAYNMATEVSSHTTEVVGSTNLAMDRLANMYLFDRQDKIGHFSGKFRAPALSSFSSPERAFFGELTEAA